MRSGDAMPDVLFRHRHIGEGTIRTLAAREHWNEKRHELYGTPLRAHRSQKQLAEARLAEAAKFKPDFKKALRWLNKHKKQTGDLTPGQAMMLEQMQMIEGMKSMRRRSNSRRDGR
jgi:hypothetical protein